MAETRAIARSMVLLIKVFHWIFKDSEANDGAGNRPDVLVIVKYFLLSIQPP
ncbi:MAG: hypothetical protein JRF41_05105 [Deltaproteobacteria bacterium]|nr:hypothetical protein [Deltaproteobacteria bacterium]MBW2322889.1 hypothetical protein [Deltaproteobacteria bacterium]